MECYKQKRDEISTYSLRYKSKVACKLRLSIILLYFHDSLYIFLIYQSVADSLLRNYSITIVKLEVTGRWIIQAVLQLFLLSIFSDGDKIRHETGPAALILVRKVDK